MTPRQLNVFYADLVRSGRRRAGTRADGEPLDPGLAPKTVRHVHTMLRKALEDAVRWGQLSRNPADRADPPRPRTPEMRTWSPEQLRVFLRHVESHRLSAAWLLLVTTGMRRGELLGLRWRELDLEAELIAIIRAHVLVDRQLGVSEPKTAKGRRTVALDQTAAVALQSHRRRQLEEPTRLGEYWQDTELVSTHEDGSPVSPRLLSV